MLLPLLLAAGLTSTRCETLSREVARSARAVYLDPSSSRRIEETKHIVAAVLTPSRSDLSNAACVVSLASQIGEFGDARILAPLLRKEAKFYWGEVKRLGAKYDRAPDGTPEEVDLSEIGRTAETLEALENRLVAQEKTELLDADPRRWSPPAFAKEVSDLRRNEEEVRRSQSPYTIFDGGEDAFVSRLKALAKRVGVLRFRELTGERGNPSDLAFEQEHFLGETELNKYEWQLDHPCPGSCVEGPAGQTPEQRERSPRACNASEVEVGRLALSVYLDPSPATRVRATTKAIERILKPLLKKGALETFESQSCARRVTAAIGTFGDPSLLKPEYAEMESAFRRRGAASGAELAAQQSAVLELPTPPVELPDPASLLAPPGAWFVFYTDAGPIRPFPDAPSVCSETRSEAEAMVARLAERRAGEERVTFAIGLPNGGPASCAPDAAAASESRRTSVVALARAWGIEKALTDSDPRAWHPAELAALVLAGRALAKEALPDTPAESIQARLAPIGLQRACRLLFSDGAAQCDGLSRRGDLAHFPFESALYRFEWEQAHRRPSENAAAWEADLAAHLATRWSETDAAAPHPDLDEVQRQIQAQERAPNPSPDPTRSELPP